MFLHTHMAEQAENHKEQSLLGDLGSTKRTTRIAAIVQLSKIGKTRAALHDLQNLTRDADREVALFAKQAVARIQARLGETAGEPLVAGLSRDHLLTPLPGEIGALRQQIAQQGNAITEELRPAVAEFLAKHGTAEDGELLLSWLETTDSMIALTYMDALETLLPKKLNEALPRLLASEHPLLRVRAIRTLKRVDPPEAQAHLAESLASRKAEERIAGLSIAFFFPFKEVKPLVLTLLSEEKDTDVLKAAETFLQLNPEVDTALRLLDLIDIRPKEQNAGLTRIFRAQCEGLQLAGILTPENARPEALVTLWRKERLKKFLTDLEIQLSFCDGGRRASIESWLAKNSGNPEVLKFIEKLAANPATDEMYQRLLKTLPPKAVLAMNLQDPSAQTPDQKRYFLEHLDRSIFEKQQAWIRREARSPDPTIRMVALKALGQFGAAEEDLLLAEESLKSPDPMLQLAGVQILDKRAPTRLSPFLGQLLASGNPLVRARGVRLSLKLDPQKAHETFKGMLVSPDPGARAQAVSCFVLFPFQKILPTLLEQLVREDNPEIARQILSVLLSNPSENLLSLLDSIQNPKNPAVSILIAQARMDLFDLILQLGLDFSGDKSEPVLEPPTTGQDGGESAGVSGGNGPAAAVPAPDQTSGKEPGPVMPVKSATGWAAKPYSVSEVRTAMRKREAAQRGQTAKEKPPIPAAEKKQLLGYCLGALLILALGGWMFVTVSSSRTYVHDEETDLLTRPEVGTPESTAIPDGFRLSAMCRLQGTIRQLNQDGSFEFLAGERKFQVRMVASAPILQGGETVELELLPYRKRKATEDYLAEGFVLKVKTAP